MASIPGDGLGATRREDAFGRRRVAREIAERYSARPVSGEIDRDRRDADQTPVGGERVLMVLIGVRIEAEHRPRGYGLPVPGRHGKAAVWVRDPG